jgi:GTP-binding protein
MSLQFNSANFLTSATNLSQCPPDTGAEVAFCGRSNSGKSSAINALTRKKSLARTSKTPGRTQMINFFSINERCRLVDLPGYGYAKVPTAVKQHWEKHLDDYLRARSCLKGAILLVDIRHPIKEFDETMIDWCLQVELPLHILLTKADKLKTGAQQNSLLSLRQRLSQEISTQIFSAKDKKGLDLLEDKLREWFS